MLDLRVSDHTAMPEKSYTKTEIDVPRGGQSLNQYSEVGEAMESPNGFRLVVQIRVRDC
ncbi:uncharacterized protein PHALS_10995 [Plasmopara halstedii]|uniref:Uncharacterized protein n=1 Tax=Plasmopara halstedii TaxID=4781 RepID=A0A0P1AIG1_PLAHL|nr:uncharacterized protein PHALS_10995 [Plasmopara halstedii]CEG40814.1 hypothetical protein PHALS_10995 [Plasmopara halstedii]|eukprot:XP_024577183.1 hypothetical protein PHALS_10995 [Plasmopara halstedii]